MLLKGESGVRPEDSEASVDHGQIGHQFVGLVLDEVWEEPPPDVYTTWDDEELGSIRVVPASGGRSRTVSCS